VKPEGEEQRLGPARVLITRRQPILPADPLEPLRELLARDHPNVGIARVHQVHGVDIHHAAGPTSEPYPRADAVVTGRRELAAVVVTADCVPLLLADREGRCVAAVHAGWRGVFAGIAGGVVAELESLFNVRPEELSARIGPAIGPCCYEVSPELGEDFTARWGGDWVHPGPAGRPHLDLPGLLRFQLIEAGLPDSGIAGGGECTLCERERWYSWRGGDADGREASAVWLPDDVPFG
jgi:polyphenol oxidase